MSDFENAVRAAAEKSILKIVLNGDWVVPDYANRFKIPAEWVQSIWAMIDRDALRKRIADRLEAELADRIVNAMAAEIATDIKQILSVKERREAIRALARDHMESIMSKGTEASQ
jgi:hypothetical protein